MVRKNFKKFMGFLASWAIKKYDMSIVVVSGWYGTEVTRELLYSVLNTKYSVRRNLINPWWDMSYPLTILGHRDYQRNWWQWLKLIFKVILRLTFGAKYKHNIVLNVNYSNQDTTKFWSSFIKPKYLVITSYKKNYPFIDKMITNTIDNKGKILYNLKDKELLREALKNYQKTYTFGKEKGKSTLLIEENATSKIYTCLDDTITVRKNVIPAINDEIIASCLLLGKIRKIDLTESVYAIIKYGLPKRLLSQIKTNLRA